LQPTSHYDISDIFRAAILLNAIHEFDDVDERELPRGHYDYDSSNDEEEEEEYFNQVRFLTKVWKGTGVQYFEGKGRGGAEHSAKIKPCSACLS